MRWLQENWVVALGLAALLAQTVRMVFWWRWLNRDRRAFEARLDAMQRRIRGAKTR
jgi:hypothetical protein